MCCILESATCEDGEKGGSGEVTYALADAVPVILVLERDAGIQAVGFAERLRGRFVGVAVGAAVAAGGFGGCGAGAARG